MSRTGSPLSRWRSVSMASARARSPLPIAAAPNGSVARTVMSDGWAMAEPEMQSTPRAISDKHFMAILHAGFGGGYNYMTFPPCFYDSPISILRTLRRMSHSLLQWEKGLHSQ